MVSAHRTYLSEYNRRSRLFYFESPTEPNVMIKMSVTRFSYSASIQLLSNLFIALDDISPR